MMNMEHQNTFNDFAESTLLPFAEQFPIQFIQGKNKCHLAYRHFKHSPLSSKLVVLVNGRAENILKWTEPAWEFFQKGYDVLVVDHRGQGCSQRLLKNRHKGYVDEFRFYVDDLNILMKNFKKEFHYDQEFMVGHSLGALISAFYLANCDHDIKKAVFVAPFFEMPSKHPIRDAFMVNLMLILGQGDRYIFGQTNYVPRDPENNTLSHSKDRIVWQNTLMDRFPNLALGGVTFRWAHLCWQAHHSLPTILGRIEIPVEVFEAGEEQVVSNAHLKEFVELLPNGTLKKMPHAKHEILFEEDTIRDEAFNELFKFFA